MPRESSLSSSNRRVRISLACNECRKRKSKCGGEQPRCLVCQTTDRNCTYNSQSRKRGLQSGYVRSLEIVLGLVLRQYPQSDKRIRTQLRNRQHLETLLESSDAASLCARWRSSECARSLNKLLITSEGPGSPSRSSADVDDGEPLDAPPPFEVENIPESDDLPRKVPEAFSSFASGNLTNKILQLELPQETIELVEIYINHMQCWFPIIKRGDLLKSVHMKLRDHIHIDKWDVGMRLCLWAIIALVSANREHKNMSHSTEQIQGLVQTSVIESDQDFELSHVQAILILVLLKIARGQSELAWVLSAQASRMISLLSQREKRDNDRFNRTIGGCILLDSMLSSLLERASCWPQEDLLDLKNELDDDSIDEWQLWSPTRLDSERTKSTTPKQPLRSLTVFHLMSELMMKLSRVSRLNENREAIFSLIQELRNWKSRLPAYCQVSESVPPSPPVVHLHLTWHFVICQFARKPGLITSELAHVFTDSFRSMYRLINQYLVAVELSGCSPLLMCHARQAIQCIEKWNMTSIQPVDVRMIGTYDELLQNLTNIWTVPTATALDTGTVQTQSEQVLNVTSQLGNQRASIAQIQAHMASCTTGGLNSQSTGLENTGESEGVFDDANTFDALLEEMSPVFPTTGMPEQLPLFSQNLGFLDNSLEGNWLDTFQHTENV